MEQVIETGSRKRVGIGVAVVALLAVLIGVIAAGMYFAPVTVPDVVGMTLEDATATLTDAGIDVRDGSAEGTVEEQSPIAGEQWRKGDQMALTFSDGTTVGSDGN